MPEEARELRDTLALYRMAEEQRIDVDFLPLRHAQSLSLPLGRRRFGIAMDPSKLRGRADERVKLCHEMGHCVTGSFYNRYAKLDVRQRHENHADRWAIGQLIPKAELEDALRRGITEIWELAEYFVVTEEYVKKAMLLYGLSENW